jgi:hypothetical protein
MALSIEALVFPQAIRNVDASLIFRRIDLMQLPEFMRSTTLRWTFLVAGIFAVFIVALLGFVYLKTKDDLTMRSDRVIASQIFRIRFSATRYSFRSSNSWSTVPVM